MTKRKMFLRMITASLLRRRSRMLIALLSIAIGATILSGLVTIYYDVPRQMGAQFRSYGANMILLPGEEGNLTAESLQQVLDVKALDDNEFHGMIARFQQKYNGLKKIKNDKNYKYSLMINNTKYYWIPIEDLP